MKIKIGRTAHQCEITNDDGSRLPFDVTSFLVEVNSDPSHPDFMPKFMIEGYLPVGSTIEVDSQTIEVVAHPDSEEYQNLTGGEVDG